MNEDGAVKVRCRYVECLIISKRKFKCTSINNYVQCGGRRAYSYVTWTFYLMNKQHLIEVKDDYNIW